MGTTALELDELPEPIIQHILSFLTGKEAAQTTLLSKSWRKAWLTQPNLAFEIGSNDYGAPTWDLATMTRVRANPVCEFATATIQRYEESNLKIQSFTLLLSDALPNEVVLWNKLIAQSLKLGATRLNLNLNNYRSMSRFVLPHDVVFGSEKLVGLSVKCCEIETGSSDEKVIRCSGLESLSLTSTHISLDVLSIIISSCPSIRKLSLTYIHCVEEEGVMRSGFLGLMNLHSLELVGVNFDTLFFGDMSSRFPNLKDLTLHRVSGFARTQDKEIWISSRSLERLNFAQPGVLYGKRVRCKFDVPSLRRFTYEGVVIPLLSFKSTSRTWESHLSFVCYKNPDSSWLHKLNKFLTKLRRSKIHLSLKVNGAKKDFDYEAGEIEGLRKRPQVENLNVDVKELPFLSCYALFDGLFQVCRPKLITQYLHPDQSRVHMKANREYFLCKAFLARQGGTSHESHFLYYGLRDLEEVNVEIFDKEVAVWRQVPLKSLLDGASTSWATDEEKIHLYDALGRWVTDEEKIRFSQKIRFQLKWKRKPHGAHL